MDPDLPLLRALQDGNESALNELIARHQGSLFHFALNYLRDETAAREVVQETFVRTYFKAARFQPRAAVKTWIYAIALNLCRDQARGIARRRRMVPLEPDGGDRRECAPVDPQAAPDEQAGLQDQLSALQRAIDALPHCLREALVLFSIEGRSQKEAAEILGTTPKTVELRVHRAKEKLRRLMVGREGPAVGGQK